MTSSGLTTTILGNSAIFGGGVVVNGALSGTTATLSGADPAPTDNVPTRVVTKAYVDAYGGNSAGALGATQDLNVLVVPGLYTGTVPSNSSTAYNYPVEATTGDLIAIRVVPLGGISNQFGQELTIQANNRKFVRTRGGGVWIQLRLKMRPPRLM